METRSGREGHQPADRLVQDVLLDLGSALPAEGAADSGEEQAQVIIDFGDRSHRGAGIAQAVLLLDGNGGRDPRHLLHVGFLDTLQELAGVGRERFHVTPLPLGINGVEGQAGLPRSADSGDHRQTLVRNPAVHVSEIVYLGASNLKNFPVHGMERLNGYSLQGLTVNVGGQSRTNQYRGGGAGLSKRAGRPDLDVFRRPGGRTRCHVIHIDSLHGCTGFFQETAGIYSLASANPYRIIAAVSVSFSNRLTNSSNVYSRPFQSINIYILRVLHDCRNYLAGSKHPLRSTAIPHIIRG